MLPSHVLYLHGFRSSPMSTKARYLAAWFAQHYPLAKWHCPALPVSPKDAARLIQHTMQAWPRASTLVIGSSLGGFYATWAAAQHACAGVLLNPAVHPARDLSRYVGVHPTWHDPTQSIEVKPAHIEEMKALYVGGGLSHAAPLDAEGWMGLPDARHLLAVIAKGDEVLDWQEMASRYTGATRHVIEGSDHGISDFADHVHVLENFIRQLPEDTAC